MLPRAAHALALLTVAVAVALQGAAAEPRPAPDARVAVDDDHAVLAAYAKLPLAFEPNRGQGERGARFLAHGRGFKLSLTPAEAVFALAENASAAPSIVRMRLVGAKPDPVISGKQVLPGKVNYLRGSDPASWVTNVPTYRRVAYRSVYPGVDLVFHGRQRRLEYDFAVASGADPRAIRLEFRGARSLALDERGDLLLELERGTLRQVRPFAYQEVDGRRQPVAASYAIQGANRVAFAVGSYDRRRPLVIDPQVMYSTYLGGSGYDEARSVTVGSGGAAYVTGETASTDFPTTPDAFQPEDPDRSRVFDDVFVTKLNADGSALVYSTYLGGDRNDRGYDIQADEHGRAYVTGATSSSNFPTTPDVLQPTDPDTDSDGFVTVLDPTGSALVASTYLGGDGSDIGWSIERGPGGGVYVVGSTDATNFPTTPGAFAPRDPDPATNDAFVTRLAPHLSKPVYSTYLGGHGADFGYGLDLGQHGAAYVSGYSISIDFPTTPDSFQPTNSEDDADAFVTKLTANGSRLVFSTYLGGSSVDSSFALAVRNGTVYVSGETDSKDFPTTPEAFQPRDPDLLRGDTFVTRLDAAGARLLYSTYLGGNHYDYSNGLAVDWHGFTYVVGTTQSNDFPTTANALQPAPGVTSKWAFLTRLDPSGSALAYSTYLGGSGGADAEGIAIGNGAMHVVGRTTSSAFPTTPGAFQTRDPDSCCSEGFVMRIAR